jgi:hypothetical protein
MSSRASHSISNCMFSLMACTSHGSIRIIFRSFILDTRLCSIVAKPGTFQERWIGSLLSATFALVWPTQQSVEVCDVLGTSQIDFKVTLLPLKLSHLQTSTSRLDHDGLERILLDQYRGMDLVSTTASVVAFILATVLLTTAITSTLRAPSDVREVLAEL